MNKFRANLHPAFFNLENWKEVHEAGKQTPKEIFQEAADAQRDLLETGKNQSNESVSSLYDETSYEAEQSAVVLENQLQKELKQLAKNKKINFDRTNDIWKCSRAEKRLAISSAKVFMQLIEFDPQYSGNKVEKLLSDFRYFLNKGNLELDDQSVADIKDIYGINSKGKDIKNFYKSFVEYQNRQSGFIHLQGLMWFFFEKGGIDSVDALKGKMAKRSVRIEKQDIKKEWKDYKEAWQKDWRERAKFDIIKKRCNEVEDPIEKMLFLMCDFNLDWEINTWDVGYRTWSQFNEVFKIQAEAVKVENKNADNLVENLVAYATTLWLKIDWSIKTVDGLYEWMTTDGEENDTAYDRTRRLQNFIQSSPADFSDILEYGKDAWKRTMTAMIRAENLRLASLPKKEEKKADVTVAATNINKVTNNVTITENWAETSTKIDERETQEAIDKKVVEIIGKERAKIEALYPDKKQSANIMKQLSNSLATALFDKATDMRRKWLSAWVAVPLDKIIEWLSAGVNIWISDNGEPLCGMSVWWDKSVDLWNWVEASLWATAGSSLFLPFSTSLSAEISKDIKSWKRDQSLTAMWVNKISLWGNVWVYPVWMWWWVDVWYKIDKKKWIEKQAKNIHDVIEEQVRKGEWLVFTGKDYQARRAELREKLATQFEKTDNDSDLDAATDNLMRIVESLPEDAMKNNKEACVNVVADVFTKMWESKAIIGITDDKFKITWWKLWIHFFAWFIPTATVVAEFTRYRNVRAVESENSRNRRIDAAVNGTWNRDVTLDQGEITEKEFEGLKGVLARYGVKNWFEYKQGSEKEQPRIKISPSVWNIIDVRVAATEMQDFIQKDEDGSYLFPTNTVYRLSTETGWNQKSAILNIGWDKNRESDIKITDTAKMSKLIWDKEIIDPNEKEFPKRKKGDTLQVTYENSSVLDLFTSGVESELKTIDSKNWAAFSKFMKTKKVANEEFEAERKALSDILEGKPELETIYSALNDERSAEEKQLIMYRVLAISANADVKTKEILDNLIKRRRKEAYVKLQWANGQSIFDKLEFDKLEGEDYRETIQKSITNENCKSQIDPSIIWATAFYNRWAAETARWLAVTWLWVTSVLWWVVEKLDDNDAKKVKNWFLGEGEWNSRVPWVLEWEKSPKERDNLMKSVTKYIENSVWEKITLSKGNLEKLLRWESVDISLDNSKEIVRISLDTECVFYLMWECANESVWLKLWNLTVLRQVDKRAKGRLVLNKLNGWNDTENVQDKFAVGMNFLGWKEKKQEENSEVKTEWGVYNLGPGSKTTPSNTNNETTDPTKTNNWTNSWNPWWEL